MYVVQKPMMRDRQTRRLVPKFDLSPAEHFGRLEYLIDQDLNPFAGMKSTIARLRKNLQGLRETDHMLLIGNPILIGLVSTIASEFCDRINFLQWSGKDGKYVAVTVDLE